MSDTPHNTSPETGAFVTFSVRDLLQRMEAKLDRAIETKADLADVTRLEGRFDGLEHRVQNVETWQHDKEIAGGVHQQRDQQFLTKREKIIGAVGTTAIVLATVIGPSLHIHL